MGHPALASYRIFAYPILSPADFRSALWLLALGVAVDGDGGSVDGSGMEVGAGR